MAKVGAKRKIAWGITGSGDRIAETVEVMIELQKAYGDVLDVRVFVSKAGEQVIKYYKLFNTLEKNFDKGLGGDQRQLSISGWPAAGQTL